MPRKNFVEQLSKPLALVFPINVNPNAAPFFNIYKPYAQQDCHIKMISRRWRHLVEADKLPLQLSANRSIELPKLQNSLAVTTFFYLFWVWTPRLWPGFGGSPGCTLQTHLALKNTQRSRMNIICGFIAETKLSTQHFKICIFCKAWLRLFLCFSLVLQILCELQQSLPPAHLSIFSFCNCASDYPRIS